MHEQHDGSLLDWSWGLQQRTCNDDDCCVFVQPGHRRTARGHAETGVDTANERRRPATNTGESGSADPASIMDPKSSLVIAVCAPSSRRSIRWHPLSKTCMQMQMAMWLFMTWPSCCGQAH